MQTLNFLKNRLTRLYLFLLSFNYNLPYYCVNCIIIKAFTSGRLKRLYLLRFLFPSKHSLARLFLITASFFHMLISLLLGSRFSLKTQYSIRALSRLAPRLLLLTVHHFLFFYEVVLTIRVIAEWYPNVNLHEAGIIGQFIVSLSEPYFMSFEENLPKGLAALFSFYLLEHVSYLLELFYRYIVLYGGGSRSKLLIVYVNLIMVAVSGENLLSIS